MKKWIAGLILFIVCSTLSIPSPLQGITDEELCLAWVVKDESRGESVKGQRAVLDVVLKRMKTRKLSACEVIKERKQFSGYKPGMKLEFNKNVFEKDLTRLWEVRKMKPVVKDSTHFHANYVQPGWKDKMKRLMQVGRHIFYREKEKQNE